MSSPAELTLNSRPLLSSRPSMISEVERIRKQEEYIKILEEERKKIEAFKRELPFCMQLLTDAIEARKAQLADSQPTSIYKLSENVSNTNSQPILEEFIPLKKQSSSEATDEKVEENRELKRAKTDKGDKPNWMVTAQLWNPDPKTIHHSALKKVEQSEQEKESENQRFLPSNSRLFSDSKQRLGKGGAFHPFSKEKQVIAPVPVRKVEKVLPDLVLSSPNSTQEVESSSLEGNETSSCAERNNRSNKETTEIRAQVKEKCGTPPNGTTKTSSTTSTITSQSQTQQRKSRRCWSPDLHRRFLNALQQLGGAQVATPKQIRELMKVDGLTNDEVKSHLQKYRLHTRRSSPAPQNANPQPQQVVLVGGFWMQPTPEYASSLPLPVTSPTRSNYSQPSISQDYYSQMNASSKLQLHPPFYCQQQQQSTPSHSQNSAEGPSPLHHKGQSSGAKGASDNGSNGNGNGSEREESVGEDRKSESTSWKPEECSD